MLQIAFARSKPLLARDATVFVRTDARKFTLDSTVDALEQAFPKNKLRKEIHAQPEITQAALFHSAIDPEGEVDLVMW